MGLFRARGRRVKRGNRRDREHLGCRVLMINQLKHIGIGFVRRGVRPRLLYKLGPSSETNTKLLSRYQLPTLLIVLFSYLGQFSLWLWACGDLSLSIRGYGFLR
jgi:hypothetical protein